MLMHPMRNTVIDPLIYLLSFPFYLLPVDTFNAMSSVYIIIPSGIHTHNLINIISTVLFVSSVRIHLVPFISRIWNEREDDSFLLLFQSPLFFVSPHISSNSTRMPKENHHVERVRKTFRAVSNPYLHRFFYCFQLSGGYSVIPLATIREELLERQGLLFLHISIHCEIPDEFGLDELQVSTFLERTDKNADKRIDMEEFERIVSISYIYVLFFKCNQMAKGLGRTNKMRKIMINMGNTVIARNQRLEVD